MKSKTKISWMASRYENEVHNLHLQIGLAFILGCILVGTLIFKNYLLSVVIIIASILVVKIKKEEPEFIPIEIDNNGISINNEFVSYDKMSSFYIDESTEQNYLLFRSKNIIVNSTRVIVIEPEVDVQELHSILIQHLVQKKIKPSATDTLVNSF